MRLVPRSFLTEALLGFGVAGGALAWAAQLVLGTESEEAHCKPAGLHWGVDSHVYDVTVTAVAAAVALAAIGVSLYAYRKVEREGGDRRGRFLFMSTSGLLAGVVFLALILLGGIGSSVLDSCVQG